MSLFESEADAKRRKLESAVDQIRSRYGGHPRVLRLDCTNPDVTDLVLREF